MNKIIITPFSDVYDSFFAKVTDDMYMELTESETKDLLQELLLNAISKFEFPRVNLFDYQKRYITDEVQYQGVESYGDKVTAYLFEEGHFNNELSLEEINILATYMIVEWLSQQLASVENVRMKYSGHDFKFTSQANHMHKILQLKKEYEREGFHLQRLYKRRKLTPEGKIIPTFNMIMDKGDF